MVRQPVVGANRIGTGIGRASCTDAGSILFAAIAIALGQQITSGPPGCIAADPWDVTAGLLEGIVDRAHELAIDSEREDVASEVRDLIARFVFQSRISQRE